jgi:hypothetical protein
MVAVVHSLIKDFVANLDDMTDEKAKSLAKQAFALREQQGELLQTCYGKVEKEISAITAARWAQVESQLGMLVDLTSNV